MHGITKNGTVQIRFIELFSDTIKAHGTVWSWKHYSKKGMSRAEFRFWARQAILSPSV